MQLQCIARHAVRRKLVEDVDYKIVDLDGYSVMVVYGTAKPVFAAEDDFEIVDDAEGNSVMVVYRTAEPVVLMEDDDQEPAVDEISAVGAPCSCGHAIRGPPRRAPSFTKRSRAAIAIGRSEGLPGVRIETRPDGTIIIHYDLRPAALGPPAEVNDFDRPPNPTKRTPR